MNESLISLFEFELPPDGVRVSAEKHYRLAPPEAISAADLAVYRSRLE